MVEQGDVVRLPDSDRFVKVKGVNAGGPPYRTFRKVSDAREWRDRQLGARARGQQITSAQPRLKLKDFIGRHWDKWLSEEVALGNLRESTAIWYRYGARHVQREIGLVKVSDVSKDTLRGMLSRRVDAGDSPAKIRQIRATTRSILGLAVELDLLASDPSDFMVGRNAPKAVKVKTSRPKAWSENDVQTFAEFISGDDLEALWVLLLTTGLRRGEALALSWGAVDLSERTISVRRSLSIVERSLRFQEPKTSSSRRTIAVGPVTISALSAHRRRQNEQRLVAESWDDELDLVFSDDGGNPLRPDTVTKRLKNLVNECGLEWIRLHGLRHTMASIALQNGTDIATVSQRLGHANTHVTARIYLHGSEESDRKAAESLDNALARSGSGQ
ncbi:MAG: tyrosine-type recombinase/integrase [Actinomycetota bacterium]